MILDDIIALATDDTASLAVVLRKCLVLAHVLKNDRLKSWAQSELNGYEPDAELPDYRKSAAGAKGTCDVSHVLRLCKTLAAHGRVAPLGHLSNGSITAYTDRSSSRSNGSGACSY